MDKEYILDSLIERFQKDYEGWKHDREEKRKYLKENHPNAEIPEWLVDDFSICIALKAICEEIKALKEMNIKIRHEILDERQARLEEKGKRIDRDFKALLKRMNEKPS